MNPIVFDFAEARCRISSSQNGVGPSWQGRVPPPAYGTYLYGVTRDSAGAAIGACTVSVFRTSDNVFFGQTISDASGNYRIAVMPSEIYFLVIYKAGSPDLAGTSMNTLTGMP